MGHSLRENHSCVVLGVNPGFDSIGVEAEEGVGAGGLEERDTFEANEGMDVGDGAVEVGSDIAGGPEFVGGVSHGSLSSAGRSEKI